MCRPNDRFPLCFAAGLSPVGLIDLIALIALFLDVALRFALLRILIQHPGIRGLSYACAHLPQLVGMYTVGVLLRDLRPVLVRGAGDLVVHLPHLYGDVYGLYRQLDERGYIFSETDYTLGLWLAAGRKAWYIRGSEAGRMKITTSHDRDLFEGYLLLKQKKQGGQ